MRVKMNELQQTINSREVAKMVGREHKNVIKDIRRIIEQLGELKSEPSYFIESTYINEQNKEQPCFDLTKKGCELYSNRMTGAKGTQFAVAYIEQFNEMENHIKTANPSIESEIKRMNAEARLKNANARLAKTFVELSKDATTEVNKILLQNKAVEVLTGEKLLEMPTLKQKLFDCDQIAKKLGVLSKNGKSHGIAVSQIIQCHISVDKNEFEIVLEAVNGWSGSIVKYSESVIEKVKAWLEDNSYPSIIKGANKNYHVAYEDSYKTLERRA